MQKKSLFRTLLCASTLVVALGAGVQASAKDLTIALRAEPTAMDPHYHSLTSNIQITQTLFDPLVCRDAQMMPQPCLAKSWSVKGKEWTFNLRDDVKFSDGTPLTAEDVVFSFDRVVTLPNPAAPLTIYTQQINKVEAIDAKTVRITTDTPYPILLNNMAGIPILSKKAGEGKTTTQLNAGNGLVGTGPYRFVSWQRGSEIKFERNPNYWGEKPEWDHVIYRVIASPASRVAALQAGDVDFIEEPPVEDIAMLLKNPRINIVQKGPTYRMMFVGLDMARETNSPGISGTAGGKNPLMDRRVREAMSLAIDRDALASRVMNNLATPAAQPLAYPMFGTRKDMVDAPKADLVRAKALMAEAGYPNGFNLVFNTPNGRYMNDVKLSQTLAAMWARIGIKVSVDAKTPSVFFTNLDKYEFSAFLLGWGAGSGEMSNPLTALLVTVDFKKGLGVSNNGRYSNPQLDALVAKAAVELDDKKRSELLQEAVKLAMDDFAILPLLFEHSIWAMRSDITYEGRMDQMTMAIGIKSKK